MDGKGIKDWSGGCRERKVSGFSTSNKITACIETFKFLTIELKNGAGKCKPFSKCLLQVTKGHFH